MTGTPQRRKFSRIMFDSAARFEIDHYEVACQVLDLSLKGALLEVMPLMEDVLRVGERCLLELALDSGASVRMEADIAHVDGVKVGVIWREIDMESITNLRRLLMLNLGDEALLGREFSALLWE